MRCHAGARLSANRSKARSGPGAVLVPTGGLLECAHAHPRCCSRRWQRWHLRTCGGFSRRHARRRTRRQVTAAQAADLKAKGFDIQEARRRRRRRPAGASRSSRPTSRSTRSRPTASSSRRSPIDKPVAKTAALGDSPNPFFNVYRSYMEPGGIADEMKALAAANPGRHEARADRHVDARQADLRDQDDRERAQRRRRHAPRDPVLGRQPRARVDRGRDGPPPAGLVRRAQERPGDPRADPDARAVVPADPEPGRLRLHLHLRHSAPRRSRATTASAPPTTTASGARRCATTTPTASTATARTASTRTATTRPSAASTRRARPTRFNSRDLPRPVRAVGAREPRRRPPAAARQVQGQHQLPLRGPAAADAGLLHDRLLPARLDAVRRHHRHRRRRGRVPVPLAALVGPLRVQRRHDRQRVHELRHHRLDAGDGHVRHARRARRAATSSPRPDNESKVEAVFNKNLAFALNVDELAAEPRSPEELRQRPEPLPGQADPGHPAEPLRRLLRRARRSSRPRSARSSATPTSRSTSSARTATSPSR